MPFKPGKSGNPNGRPQGSRHRLSEDFIKALADDFADHGVETIRAVREADPAVYVRVIASVLPKESTLTIDNKRDATDWTRAELVAFLSDARDGGKGAAKANGRGGKPDRVH